MGHLDHTVASGTFGTPPALPYVPGTDGAGHVVTSERFPTGACVRLRGGGLGTARDGTWAELVAVPDDALWALPDGADPALAACFFSPATTAHLAVHEVGQVQPGERVAVTGASGAVGSLAAQLAREAGAEVVGLVRSAAKLAALPDGVTGTTDRAALAAIDLLIDTVGGDGLAALLPVCRPGGRAVLIGYTAGTQVTLDLPAFLRADVRLLPVNLLRRGPSLGPLGDDLLARLHAGDLTLRVETFPLAEAPRALAHLTSGNATGRVALLP